MIDNSAPEIAGHGRRVSLFSKQIAQILELSELEIMNVEIAGLLHDIGKIGLSQKLLLIDNKKVTEEEKEQYQKHPEEGQIIVRFIKKLDHVGLIIRSHHERFDGKGFPDQLSGDVIPIESQIIAISDQYDKIVYVGIDKEKIIKEYLKERDITGDHLAPDALLKAAAVSSIKKNSFSEYAPDVVKAFLDVTEKQGVSDQDDIEVPLDKLSEGMILSRSLYTTNGRFLLPYNTKLTSELIHKLKTLQSRSPLIINSLPIKK